MANNGFHPEATGNGHLPDDPAAARAQFEAELAELIDDALPPAALDRVLARLAREPRLAARVAAMHRDRMALQEWTIERVPQDLVTRALAHTADELQVDPLMTPLLHGPVRAGAIHESSGHQRARGASRRLPWSVVALAAGVALLTSGTALLVALAITPRPRLPLAVHPEGVAPTAPRVPAERMAAAPAPASRAATLPPEAMRTEPAVSAHEELAVADPVATLDVGSAFMYLQRGELLIRVLAPSVVAAPAELDRLAALSEGEGVEQRELRAWSLSSAVSSDVLAALPRRTWPATALPGTPQGPVHADSSAAGVPRVPGLPQGDSPVLATYLADVKLTPAALESLRTTLATKLRGRVVFEHRPELARPLGELGSAPSTEDVLWWTQPPARWAVRAHVPVVLEFGVTPEP